MTIVDFKQWSMRIICMFLYCLTTIVFAQEQNALSQTEFTAFQKSLEGKSYDEVLDVFYDHYEIDSTKTTETIQYITTHFLNAKNKVTVADAYLTIALWQDKNGNLAEALAKINKGIAIAKTIDNKDLQYIGYVRKGAFLFDTGENKAALNAFLNALEIAKIQKDTERQIRATNNIILIKIQANDNLGAIDLYHENLEIIEESKDEIYEVSRLEIYLGLCKAYINVNKFEEATRYCKKGVALSEKLNALNFKAYLLSGLGDIASHTEKYKEAYQYFEEANKVITEFGGDKKFDLFMKLYVGKTYFLEGKYKKAVVELTEGEKLIKASDVEFLSIQELYYYLARSYKELGNNEEGIKYYDKAKEIDDENDKTREEINANLVKKFDLVKLKEELEARSKRSTYYFVGGIILLLIVIVGLLVYTKKQQQRNKKRFQNLMCQLEEKRSQEKQAQQKKEIEVNTISKETPAKQTAKESKIQPEIDDITAEILEKLAEFEKKEWYLSQDSTLVEVAKKLQTNTTYLSKVINTYKEKSFTAYITDLRVDYAIERLSIDRKFRSFTIGAIAQEIGFKRSESFSKAFKVKTGLYPSYFIKELEKQ